MTACFADTYYFFAILNPRDDAHVAATEYNAVLNRPLVTTPWVLTEVADGLATNQSRPLFGTLLDRLGGDARVTIVPPTQELFERGTALYRERSDKTWSLTDCISFVVMQDRGLTDALTGDHHFEQAGFTVLLRRGQ
jgi:hypothetical protein